MSERDSHYATLGIQPDATQEAIQTAYRRRAMQAHPDRTGSGPADFQGVQEAYRVLGNPERRREYDRGLERSEPRVRRARGPATPRRRRAAAFAEGAPEPFAEGAPEPFAEGAPEPFAEGTPEPFAEGAPEPFAEGAPEPPAEAFFSAPNRAEQLDRWVERLWRTAWLRWP